MILRRNDDDSEGKPSTHRLLERLCALSTAVDTWQVFQSVVGLHTQSYE